MSECGGDVIRSIFSIAMVCDHRRVAKGGQGVYMSAPLLGLMTSKNAQPIKRALQDENCSVLIDHGLAFAAADVGGDQFALHGGCG
jgi:hypothetical protein